MTSADVHGPRWWSYPAHRPLAEWRTAVTSQVVVSPGGWGIREVVSHDLPVLWPYWHEAMRQRFQQASHEERLRFLERVGVRYCALPEPPRPDARPLVRIPWVGSHALYDCGTRVSRASVVAGAIIQPSLKGQLDLMFEDKAFDPLATVLLNAAPPAGAGVPGPPQPPSARIVEESATRITVEATTGPRGGFLVLLDSQHPYWRASVDGRPARILPANAVFRAVRLAPGRHVVRFVYRPVALMAGAAVSGVVGLALLATVRRRGARPRGDTNRHPI
jgi:hypothetical protein